MVRIGIIGYGYWGPNLVRNFSLAEDVKVAAISDLNAENRAKASKLYPSASVTADYRDITQSPDIDAVAIATPVFTHFDLAKSALENGKHVFVEKPFTTNAAQARELIEIAEQKGLTLMVDHTFLFTGAVKKIKQLIDEDVLGELCYYDSTRINLGLFQHDINVVWDLAPHDLSIMDYVIKSRPVALAAHGIDHFNRNMENVAYITVYFEDNIIAHFNVNWLSPVKIRTTLIGGLKNMLVWNDLESDEKIKIYDKGVDVETKDGMYNQLMSYRSGDMWAPKLERFEALRKEANYFITCIKSKERPINDGNAGLRIVRMLEATDRSIKNKGIMIDL